MHGISKMEDVVEVVWWTMLMGSVPVGKFSGLSECGIVGVRCVTERLWGWVAARSGCEFVTDGDEGRGRERAWDMKDGVGFGRAGVGLLVLKTCFLLCPYCG